MIDKTLFDWSKTFKIKISDIKYAYCDVLRLNKDWGKDFGSILDKPMNNVPYEDMNVLVTSMRQFILEGVPIEQTKEFTGRRYANVKKDEGWDDFVKGVEDKWITCYESIKKYGLLSQEEIMSSQKGYISCPDGSDEIACVIDDCGRLLFFNGGHRIACAIMLGIKDIPVRIAARHKEWCDFILWLWAFNKKSWRAENKTYQTLDHIDFRGFIPEWSPDYRYNKIKQNLSIASGTILDIGALWGAFCQRFEELGFDCTAVERDPRMVKVMKTMRKAKGKTFTIVSGDVFNLKSYNYDIIIAVNIFHHFCVTKELHEKLKQMLQKITCKEFYFQAHNKQMSAIRSLYVNYAPEEFAQFIIDNIPTLNAFKEIGEERGRKLYKLYRT